MKEQKTHESDARKCLAIGNNKKAFACLKKVVAQAAEKEDPHSPKLVLLVSEGCTPCEEEAALHKEDIDKGIIQKIDFTSEEGLEIAEKNDIELTPSLVLLDCDNKLIEPD
ncbi:MAG: hypothetical protein KAR06_02710 [Deltaproteobacteria bacterium]|nr:hypothetical protein [Deltaproteobacteria bacterium]